MSDTSQGDGWWMASDGKWYAPELHPDYVPPAPPEPPAPEPPAPEAAAPPPTEAVPAAPPPYVPDPTIATAPVDPSVAQPPFAAAPPTQVIPPVAPIVTPPAGPPGTPPVGPGGPPPGEGQPFYRKPVVILVVVLAIIAGGVAAYALTSGGDKKVSTKSDASDKSSSSASSDSTGSKTTTTKKKSSTTTSSGVAPAGDAKLTIVAGGSSTVDSSGTRYALAGATVMNPDAKLAAYDVKVVFNLLDAGGTVLDTDTVMVDYIGPGKTVFAAPASIGYAASADVAKVDVKATADLRKDDGYKGVEFGVYKGVDIKVADAAIKPDDFASSIVGHLTNPSDKPVDYSFVTCVIYSGSKIVGGTSTSVGDTIVPGATIEFDAYIDFVPAGADGAQCQAIA